MRLGKSGYLNGLGRKREMWKSGDAGCMGWPERREMCPIRIQTNKLHSACGEDYQVTQYCIRKTHEEAIEYSNLNIEAISGFSFRQEGKCQLIWYRVSTL